MSKGNMNRGKSTEKLIALLNGLGIPEPETVMKNKQDYFHKIGRQFAILAQAGYTHIEQAKKRAEEAVDDSDIVMEGFVDLKSASNSQSTTTETTKD